MASPHLLRPFSSRQLSLIEGDDRVACFAVLGGRYAGPSALVHAPTLIKRVMDLPAVVDTVVFFDEPVPDAATVAAIDAMLAEFRRADADVLSAFLPATEAVKRVDLKGHVVEGVDRRALVSIRCPEVIDRNTLSDAVRELGDELWVNPTHVVATRGGKVRLHDRPTVTSPN